MAILWAIKAGWKYLLTPDNISPTNTFASVVSSPSSSLGIWASCPLDRLGWLDFCAYLFIYLFIYLLIYLFIYLFIYFREKGRKGEKEGEKHQCVVASHTPYWGPVRKPRYVPWLGIKLIIFGSQAHVQSTELCLPGLSAYLSRLGLVRFLCLPWAATTKYHMLGSFNKRNLFSHSSGGWKSKIKVLTGLVSPKVSLLDLQMTAFLLCPHIAFPQWERKEQESSAVSSLHRRTPFTIIFN